MDSPDPDPWQDVLDAFLYTLIVEIATLSDDRLGSYSSLDHGVVGMVLERFPHTTPQQMDRLLSYAAFLIRSPNSTK